MFTFQCSINNPLKNNYIMSDVNVCLFKKKSQMRHEVLLLICILLVVYLSWSLFTSRRSGGETDHIVLIEGETL